jgi:hypothetical protein
VTSSVTTGPTPGAVPTESVAERAAAAHVGLAVVTVLAGAVLLGGSYLGNVGLLVAVGVVQAALVVSWVFGTALPGRIGALILGILASGAVDAAVTRWYDHGYQPVLGVLGLAIPVMFIHQLTRGVVRTRVVESLADITILIIAVTAIAGLLLLRRQSNGDVTTLAVIGSVAAGLLVSHLTDAVLPAPRFDPLVDRGLPAVVLGVLVGGAIGLLALNRLLDFAGGRGAFAGAAVAAVACLISIGATFAGFHSTLSTPSRSSAVDGDEPIATGVAALRPVAAVLMTIALSAPAGYVLINALSN